VHLLSYIIPLNPINQTYTLLFRFQLPSSTLTSVDISHSVCQNSCPFSFAYVIPICPSPRPCVTFCNMLIFYGVEALSTRSATNLENHPSSALRDSSIYVLAIIRHIWRTALHRHSLFTNNMKNTKRLLSQSSHVSTLSRLLSLHVQCYCQCHNTDNRHWS
jgi:hypothetical protein